MDSPITAPGEACPGSGAPDPVCSARALAEAIEAAASTIEATRRIPSDLTEDSPGTPVPHAAAARGRRRPGAIPATYLLRDRGGRRGIDGSVAWNVFVGNSAALIARLHLGGRQRATIFADPRSVIAWGPPNQRSRERRARRLPGARDVSTSPAAAGWQSGWACIAGCGEADRTLRQNQLGRPGDPHADLPGADQARLLGHLESDRAARHRVQFLHGRGRRSSPRPSAAPVRIRRCGGSRDGSTPSPSRGSMRSGWRAWRWARPGRCCSISWRWPWRSHRAASRCWRRTRWCRPRWRGPAPGWARRGPGWSGCSARCRTPPRRARRYQWRSVPDCAWAARMRSRRRSRWRISPTNRPGWMRSSRSPFERRFRDIHTLSQQIQSRAAHFAAVGQVMLGRAPPGFL